MRDKRKIKIWNKGLTKDTRKRVYSNQIVGKRYKENGNRRIKKYFKFNRRQNMKIENIELVSITTTEKETKEETKTLYTATFENKDEGLKININQEHEFDLVVGESYSIKVDTEQKKL